MKVGLYSITYLGLWYRGEALLLEESLGKAKEYGYEGIEIDGKRPHGNPLDMPAERCREVRRAADGEGIEIYAVAANNDFSSPISEQRECQLLYVHELIRMTSLLGAGILRVFAAWPGVTRHPQIARYDIARGLWKKTQEGFTDEERWERCRAGLAESARYAGEFGVTLALQNHGPVIEGHGDMLRMIREVGSPNLKACLDAPLLQQKDPAAVRRAALEVGPLQVLSHFGGDYTEACEDGLVKGQRELHAAFARGMQETGYEGYIGYELCHPLPAVEGRTVGRDYVDTSARLAAQFMREIIAAVRAEK